MSVLLGSSRQFRPWRPGTTPLRTRRLWSYNETGGYGLLLLSLVGVLAVVWPAPLGQAGVPGAEVTKPPWIFLPFYPLEDLFGISGLLIGSALLFALLGLVPFVERSPWLSPRRRRWIVIAATGLLIVLIVLGGYAWISRPAPHLMG